MMKAIVLTVIIWTTFLSIAESNEDLFRHKGVVIELDDTNFDTAISTFDHILVDFYAPWCGHCKRLSPELEAAAPVLVDSDKPIVLAKIDADKFTGIASKYKVSGYPTLKFFINGFPTDYSGPRKAESLILHLKKIAAPEVSVLKSNHDIQEFIKASGKSFPIFIGFDVKESLLAGLAKKYKKRAWFSVAEDFSDEVMVEFDFDKKPALLALRPEYNEQDIFYGPFEGGFLEDFIKQSMLPLCVPIRYDTLKLLTEDSRPVALTIVRDEREDESLQLIKNVKAAASGNRDLVFGYVGANQWEEFVDAFGVGKKTKLPTIIIWNGETEFHNVVGSETLNGEDMGSEITRFLEGYRQGRIIKRMLKEPSFVDFLKSFISIKSVYILVFVVVILMVMWHMMGMSENEETSERVRLREDRLSERRQFTDPSKVSTGNAEDSEAERMKLE